MTYPHQGNELTRDDVAATGSTATSSHLLERVVLIGLVASAVALGAFLFEALTRYAM